MKYKYKYKNNYKYFILGGIALFIHSKIKEHHLQKQINELNQNVYINFKSVAEDICELERLEKNEKE